MIISIPKFTFDRNISLFINTKTKYQYMFHAAAVLYYFLKHITVNNMYMQLKTVKYMRSQYELR
jgi:hypothetical protein